MSTKLSGSIGRGAGDELLVQFFQGSLLRQVMINSLMSVLYSGNKRGKYQFAYTSQLFTFISRGQLGYHIKELDVLEK